MNFKVYWKHLRFFDGSLWKLSGSSKVICFPLWLHKGFHSLQQIPAFLLRKSNICINGVYNHRRFQYCTVHLLMYLEHLFSAQSFPVPLTRMFSHFITLNWQQCADWIRYFHLRRLYSICAAVGRTSIPSSTSSPAMSPMRTSEPVHTHSPFHRC